MHKGSNKMPAIAIEAWLLWEPTGRQPANLSSRHVINKSFGMCWLGGRDSNPDTQIQSLQSYR